MKKYWKILFKVSRELNEEKNIIYGNQYEHWWNRKSTFKLNE
jgi:hypothetical protein